MKYPVVAWALLASACRLAGDDGGGAADVGSQEAEVRAVDRKILGAAAKYQADGTLRGREGELLRSPSQRRALGWRTVEKVLAPVALAEALPDSGAPARIPAFHTWYAKDDVERIFQRLYSKLDPDARRRREAFTNRAIDDAFVWNVRAVEEQESWPQERWRTYLASLDSADKVDGIGGIDRGAYSAEAVRHLLASYPKMLECLANGVPARDATGPAHEARALVRERLHLAPREQRRLGPFVLLEGETLQSLWERYEGTAEAPPPSIAIGAPFHVSVEAGAAGFDGALALGYGKPHPEWATCTAGTFPLDAVVIKADWQRVAFGRKMKAYDTSLEGMKRRLAPEGTVSWEKADSEADPGPDRIYTVKLENGNVFRLAGLHIMTKELDHWLWTTLWWSSSPAEDFGADRPSSIGALGAVWQNYKMCTVTGFEEEGGPSWCSNPYIERGAGNAGTNCVGCHQHGGTPLRSEEILRDPVLFPANGRTRVRNNFATDYSWAIHAGDRLGAVFKGIVDHYDARD